MPQYDPQRSRRRQPPPRDDEPAPVDALLEPPARPERVDLPRGVEVEVVGGEVVVHTDEADVEISPRGDDIVVHTDQGDVEVLPTVDEVIVSTPTEDVYVDTASGSVDHVDGAGRRSRRVAWAAVGVAAVIAVWLLVRRWAGRRTG